MIGKILKGMVLVTVGVAIGLPLLGLLAEEKASGTLGEYDP